MTSSLTLSCELIVLHLHRCTCLYTVRLKILSVEALQNGGPNMAARAHSSVLRLYGRCVASRGGHIVDIVLSARAGFGPRSKSGEL